MWTYITDELLIWVPVLLTADGQPILNVNNKLISIHKAFYIRGGDNSDNPEVARVTSHLALIGAKMDVSFKNVSNGSDVSLDVRGDWISRYVARAIEKYMALI